MVLWLVCCDAAAAERWRIYGHVALGDVERVCRASYAELERGMGVSSGVLGGVRGWSMGEA